jgi:L-alanine-DL-glutamate epimerase-like enolase superfamily enzyme
LQFLPSSMSSRPAHRRSTSDATAASSLASAPIERLDVHVVRVPTDAPESDGTLRWDATTVVICRAAAAGRVGVGYTYASRAAAAVIEDTLRACVVGADALALGACSAAMQRAVRNVGAPGVAAMAISAVDIALWDLLGWIMRQPLHRLLGACRDAVPAYGSGGFTSYSQQQLCVQFEDWARLGVTAFKMKVGREPERDVARVREARAAIGPAADLYVDANGAYTRRQALELARGFADLGVSWFEEPVTSDDAAGLAWLRDRCPAPVRIAAGEYGYRLDDFKRLLDHGAVDVLMADATRCGGVTGFMRVAALAAAYRVPLSSHCAPTVHRHLGCAVPEFEIAEYFHDHARLEPLLFEGAARIDDGCLRVAADRPGLGIALLEPPRAPVEVGGG